jgi:integrase
VAGKQAKIIADGEARRVLRLTARGRYPARDRVMLLLSLKAGLRACEIAGLTWAMVLDPRGQVGAAVEVRDSVAKRSRGRVVPLNAELRQALCALHRVSSADADQPVIVSERGGPMCAMGVVNWFARLYRQAELIGCSSHSGRRTFITKAARLVFKVGGSLRDVQQLAGHASLDMTQRYIEGDTAAKRALVNLI